MADAPLTPREIADRLAELPSWELGPDGDLIGRTYTFRGHLPAASMVLPVAQLQEELDHHAELRLGYRTLTVSVTTHSAGNRLTERDFALARQIEAIAPGLGAS